MVTQSSQWQINSSVYLFCFSVLTVVITQGFYSVFYSVQKSNVSLVHIFLFNAESQFPWRKPQAVVRAPLLCAAWLGCAPQCVHPAGQPAGINSKTPRCDGHTSLFAALHLSSLVYVFFFFGGGGYLFFFPLSYKELVAHSGFECSLCLFLFCSRL